MAKKKQQKQVEGLSLGAVLVGALVGALAGALAMLLMAPQSGKKTRAKIEKKGKQLRQQAADTIEGGVEQVRTKANEVVTKANEVSAKLHKQAEDLQQRGHEVIEHQKERWTPVVEASKAAVNGS